MAFTSTASTINPSEIVRSFFKEVVAHEKEAQKEIQWSPRANLYDLKEKVILELELPGVGKENISLDIEDNRLKISGEKKPFAEVEKAEYQSSETQSGKFSRSFRLGKEMDPQGIQASYQDGILTLEVPRKEKAQARKISIQ